MATNDPRAHLPEQRPFNEEEAKAYHGFVDEHFHGMEGNTEPLGHMAILSAVAHYAREIARLTEAVPVECDGALPEYESVGYQYKYPTAFGGYTWRDSASDYNGGRYVEAREIFAKRRAAPQEGL